MLLKYRSYFLCTEWRWLKGEDQLHSSSQDYSVIWATCTRSMTFAIKNFSPWFGEDSFSNKDAVYLFNVSLGLTREVGLGGGAHCDCQEWHQALEHTEFHQSVWYVLKMAIDLQGSMPLAEAQSSCVWWWYREEDAKGSNTVPCWLQMERSRQDPVYLGLFYISNSCHERVELEW